MAFFEDFYQTNFVEKMKELEKEVEKLKKGQHVDSSEETEPEVIKACVEARRLKAEQEGESAKVKLQKEKAEVEKLLIENAKQQTEVDKVRSEFFWSESLNTEKCKGEIARIQLEVEKNNLEKVKLQHTILQEEEGRKTKLDIEKVRREAELKQVQDTVNLADRQRMMQDELQQVLGMQELAEAKDNAKSKEKEREKQFELRQDELKIALLKYDLEIKRLERQQNFEVNQECQLEKINEEIKQLERKYGCRKWWYIAGVVLGFLINGAIIRVLWEGTSRMQWHKESIFLGIFYLFLIGLFIFICVGISKVISLVIHYDFEERKVRNELRQYWENRRIKLHPLSKMN